MAKNKSNRAHYSGFQERGRSIHHERHFSSERSAYARQSGLGNFGQSSVRGDSSGWARGSWSRRSSGSDANGFVKGTWRRR